MKNFGLVTLILVSLTLVGCQKQQTEEERRAELEREVQQRLAAERQQEQTQQIARREAELSAREQALSEQERQAARPVATATPQQRQPISESEEREGAGSYSMFYTKLEPYGDWIETNNYGYVYRPREATSSSWRPYTNGHWIYTDAGWTWISEEPFGWATYHYGRWTRLHNIGWIWVPGEEWAPAWVSWRKGGEYVGWAPLPPEARFDRRSGIRNWSDNYYDVGPDQYVFVPTNRFGEQRVERAIVPPQQNITIVNQTTNVTNITYNNTIIVNQGPNYDELRAQNQQPIARLRLQRQVTLRGERPEAVVRGEFIEMPAPVIAPARTVERPRTVKETVAQTTVDLGWAAVTNQPEAERARAKMKSESTPPPDAPPKKFVKASAAAARAATASPTGTAMITPSAPPRPTETPTATATATATIRPVATTPAATAAASPEYTTRPRLTPELAPKGTPIPSAPTRPTFTGRPTSTPRLSPSPAATAETQPPASRLSSPATPTASVTPRAPFTPTATPRAAFSPGPILGSPLPAASPSAESPSPTVPKAGGAKRTLPAESPGAQRPASPSPARPFSPTTTPSFSPRPTISPASMASPSPTIEPMPPANAQERGKGPNKQRRPREGGESPAQTESPTPSPSSPAQ